MEKHNDTTHNESIRYDTKQHSQDTNHTNPYKTTTNTQMHSHKNIPNEVIHIRNEDVKTNAKEKENQVMRQNKGKRIESEMIESEMLITATTHQQQSCFFFMAWIPTVITHNHEDKDP